MAGEGEGRNGHDGEAGRRGRKKSLSSDDEDEEEGGVGGEAKGWVGSSRLCGTSVFGTGRFTGLCSGVCVCVRARAFVCVCVCVCACVRAEAVWFVRAHMMATRQ